MASATVSSLGWSERSVHGLLTRPRSQCCLLLRFTVLRISSFVKPYSTVRRLLLVAADDYRESDFREALRTSADFCGGAFSARARLSGTL